MAIIDNIAHYWRFNETGGTTTSDAHGSLSGTLMSGATFNSSGKESGCALMTNQSRISFGDNMTLQRTDAFSFSFWYYAHNTTNMIFQKTATDLSKMFYLSEGSGSFQFRIYTLTGNKRLQVTTTNSTTVNDGFHHIVLTNSGAGNAAGIKLYIDGVSKSLTTDSDTLDTTVTTTQPFLIGNDGSNPNINFSIDEFGQWNKTLSQSEVTSLYRNGYGLFYDFDPVLTEPTNLSISDNTHTTLKVNWTNNNTEYITGNTIQNYNGSWSDIANVTSGSTNYTVTGLTPITSYTYRVVAKGSGITAESASVSGTTMSPAPTGLTATAGITTAVAHWHLPYVYGTSIKAEYKLHTDGSYTTQATLGSTVTGYTYTGLTYDTNYDLRVTLVGSDYPSNVYNFTTLYSYVYGTASTTNLTCYQSVDGIITFANLSGGSGQYEYSIDNKSSWQSTIQYTGLTAGTYHCWVRDKNKVANTYDVGNKTLTQPAELNAVVNHTDITSCGGSDGTITFTNPSGGTSGQYEYRISITDPTWYSSGSFTGLPADLYRCDMRDKLVPSCEISVLLALRLYEPILLAGTIGSDETTCRNMTPSGITTLTSPSGVTGIYTYQWQSSLDNSNWSDIVGSTGTGYNPPMLTQTTYYRKRVTSNLCVAYTNTVTKTIYGTLYAGQIGSNQTIIQGATPAQLTTSVLPTGSSAYYIYSWQDSPDGVNFTPIALTYGNTYQPPALYATTWYRKRVFDNYCYDVAYTDAVRIIVDVPQAPAGLGVSGNTCDGFTFYWENLGSRQGDIIVRYLDLNTMSWEIYGTYPSGTTSTVFTGLTYNQGGLGAYDLRVSNYYNGTYYTSYNLTGQNPISPAAPTNLTGTTSGCTQVLLTWVNPSCYDKIHVQRQTQSGNVDIAVLTGGETQYLITGLTVPSNINYQIVNEYGLNFYAGFPYNYITPLECSHLEDFCTIDNAYTVVSSTAGNMDGMIILNSDGYQSFYDFYLSDAFGNTYPLYVDTFYVTAGYYFLSAIPKPQYYNIYGTDGCMYKWIAVNDSDTDLYLISVSVRPEQSIPFDKQSGRIFYKVGGLVSGHTYGFYVFNSASELVYQKTGITDPNDFLYDNAAADCYYSIIIDETNNQHLILEVHCVPSLSMYSSGGIKRVWLAKWSDDIDYNYWDSKDDDYFLEFEDSSFFNSTKIKEFKSLSGGTIQWYVLPVVPQVAKLEQKLGKVRQGYIFVDTLTIAIAHATADKWVKMQTLLSPDNRWLYVCEDFNGYYWTGGYRHGAQINTYNFNSGLREEDNGYQLVISAQSENKILTSIDTQYVIDNII